MPPPPFWRAGLQLAEVRWATSALALFLAGWFFQSVAAPVAVWWTAYLACYLIGGWKPALSGVRAAFQDKTLDVDLLMIVAAVAAASIGQVFDGALLIVIFATSGALEVVVTQRTADSVNSLLDLAPEQAGLVAADGTVRVVETKDLEPGQRILIRPGERIGADGTVIDGVSEVDQQAVTGEFAPVVRRTGDEVLSGTVNGTGALVVEVTRPASESVVARIVALVDEASGTTAKTQLFIEKVEQAYSFGVVVATLLVLLVPMVLFEQSFADALLRAIVFMIVASPCAVVLSTMPPLLASIANAGRHGVLVKSAAAMEAMARTSVVAFDKTGTLTEGVPEVVGVTTESTWTESAVIAKAAAVEAYSEHPLGRAIAHAAVAACVGSPAAVDFQAMPGRGVTGVVDGRRVTVERADEGSATTGTVVVVRVDGERAGTITLVDRVRPGAATVVREMRALAPHGVLLLTGDNESAARSVADETGIADVHAGLLPEDKAVIVSDLGRRGEHVLLVGDGVNDAPALAVAGTGVAMGRRGSDLAIDTADVVVVRDDLSAVSCLVRLSTRAHRYVVANLCIAAAVIAVLVGWDLVATLPLPLAVAGHEGSTVIVALNGARLLRRSAWRS
ncbi:MAG: heavy metal translocating P-type ATPase [Gordonia sp. (in: high G+C Gram-positive bacteria)]|uniref:heavy metal translocating P-type ATPase n=1 Tax=Gordonia sp. PP30 TaxID=2935861 RepID=UPI0024B62086|nr:heavy metal translocating P-type ATPase [Gordonia sp. PP30]